MKFLPFRPIDPPVATSVAVIWHKLLGLVECVRDSGFVRIITTGGPILDQIYGSHMILSGANSVRRTQDKMGLSYLRPLSRSHGCSVQEERRLFSTLTVLPAERSIREFGIPKLASAFVIDI